MLNKILRKLLDKIPYRITRVKKIKRRDNAFYDCPACGGTVRESITAPGWYRCYDCKRNWEYSSLVDDED